MSYITDIEAVYVLGDFGAYTPSLTPGAKNTLLSPADFWIGPRKTSLALDQLAQSGYLFFGGQITFEKDFEATGAETPCSPSAVALPWRRFRSMAAQKKP